MKTEHFQLFFGIQKNLFYFHYFLLGFARIAEGSHAQWGLNRTYSLSRKIGPEILSHFIHLLYLRWKLSSFFFFYGCQDQFARLHCSCCSLFFFPSFPLPNTWRKRYYCDPILVPYIRYYFLDTKSRLHLLMLKFELVGWFNFQTRLAGFSER